jgi:hypothetical protein
MILNYRSGDEIKKADRVLFHGNPAEIELVASNITGDPETDWYIEEFGGGVMISDPMVSGRTFIPADQIAEYEGLQFVSRTDSDLK